MSTRRSIVFRGLATAAFCCSGSLFAQTAASPVLVELFTSEGCSSCPPADALLRQVSMVTVQGHPVIALSEHVTYWNGLGWNDRFSAGTYTARQDGYARRFGLDSVYTPQMVVDGRTQFVGNDRVSLEHAIGGEAHRQQVAVQVKSASLLNGQLTLSFSVSGPEQANDAEIFAALTDDTDRTEVARGENGGRTLLHAAVARLLGPVGTVHGPTEKQVVLPLSAGFSPGKGGHHVVVFVQAPGLGSVLGVGSRAL